MNNECEKTKYLVCYICSYTNRSYTFTTLATNAQEAVDECIASNGYHIPIDIVSVYKLTTVWEQK